VTIQEILTAHQIGSFSSDGHNRVMTCSGCREQLTGQGLSLDEIIRAHVAEVLDKHMAEQEATALEEAADEIDRIDPAWDSALWIEPQSHYVPLPEWLRERANQIKEGK